MFYCKPCGDERDWPTDSFWPHSRGKCELCDEYGACLDIPSSRLPMPTERGPSRAEIDAAIESIKGES